MDPTTGTFISMDSYAGNGMDPITLHKYLYANANPVTYSDPTGYFSLAECSVVQSIQGILNGMHQITWLTKIVDCQPFFRHILFGLFRSTFHWCFII